MMLPELPFPADRDDVVALRAFLEALEGGRHACYPTPEQFRRVNRVIDHIDRLAKK